MVISDNLFQIALHTLVGTQGHDDQCTDRGAIFENQCTHQQMGHEVGNSVCAGRILRIGVAGDRTTEPQSDPSRRKPTRIPNVLGP